MLSEHVALTTIEGGWVGSRARELGALEAHVRFMQWVVRCTQTLRPGCWAKGQLRAPLRVAMSFGRSERRSRCGGGENLATDSEFTTQRELSEEMLS